LLVAHALLQAHHDVELYSDRSPEDWLAHGRPTGTAVRFARSLAYERRLGLTHGHDEAPRMDGVKMTICSHPGKPMLALFGRFAVSPLAIDLRLQRRVAARVRARRRPRRRGAPAAHTLRV
jgi:hypothetical protein